MYNFCDKIYVINLNERTDRLTEITEILKSLGLSNFERISASKFTEEDLSDAKLNKIYQNIKKNTTWIRSWSPEKQQKYLLGSLGCLMSHYRVISQAKKEELKTILILEDDFGATNNFWEIMNQIKDFNLNGSWDMLYFSVKERDKNHNKIPASNGLKRIKRGYRTCSYLVRCHLFDEILNNCLKFAREIDVFYSARIHPKFKCYVTYPMISYQRESYSNITHEIIQHGGLPNPDNVNHNDNYVNKKG